MLQRFGPEAGHPGLTHTKATGPTPMDIQQTLKATDIFRNVPDDELSKVADLCTEIKFAKGELIMEEGSEGLSLYVIPEGVVGIDVRVGENIYKQRAYEVTQGDVFGELALFGHKRTARVRALSDVTLLEIPCEGLRQTMRETPRIGYYVMHNLSRILAERLMMANITMQDVMARHHLVGE